MKIANHSERLLKLDLQLFSEELPPEAPIDLPEGGEPIDTPPAEPTDPTPPQEEFDIIKYNKEEIKIPVTERQTYLQKGYNYDKVQQKASDYEQHLNRVAQITGYQSIDELIKAAEEAEKQSRVQQEASKLGMQPEDYQQYVAPMNDELASVKQQLEEMKRESFNRQIESELAELQKNENFAQYEQPMWDLAQKYGMTLTEAFEFASLKGLKEQIPNLQQQAEQKVVNQIKARQGKHVETHDENALVSLNLSPEELATAQKMGIAPEEYAKWK
ncbi:hypothetical protein [Cytobacillus oceanisediminis]|uniref:hypothetical protein n=1 Tax=Cytobacillus oceanisediminis TaxID=665099 RepID=UPI001C246B89|nr:hypothetical protein [Cytobacillus oceanisediminis]MBU8770328.1 hypothetical protein [Cytobacillus oceanisediminis]